MRESDVFYQWYHSGKSKGPYSFFNWLDIGWDGCPKIDSFVDTTRQVWRFGGLAIVSLHFTPGRVARCLIWSWGAMADLGCTEAAVFRPRVITFQLSTIMSNHGGQTLQVREYAPYAVVQTQQGQSNVEGQMVATALIKKLHPATRSRGRQQPVLLHVAGNWSCQWLVNFFRSGVQTCWNPVCNAILGRLLGKVGRLHLREEKRAQREDGNDHTGADGSRQRRHVVAQIQCPNWKGCFWAIIESSGKIYEMNWINFNN